MKHPTRLLRSALVAAPLLVAANASALQFNLTFTAATTTAARDSFNAAAARWSSLFADPITVNLNVGLTSFSDPNTLGSTNPTTAAYSYSAVRTRLIADATTAVDVVGAAGLQAGPNLSISTNYFANNPNTNRATPFTTNVSSLSVNSANAKALGLLGATTTSDGTVTFATAYQNQYDYNPSNGIGAGLIDFTGIATHEIGHALGFISGVDLVDQLGTNTSFNSSSFAFVTPFDLFRRSGISTLPDMTVDQRSKYFSLDNGVTNLTLLSLGASNRGDGAQASHWKDSLGLGIMDPTASNGELLSISQNDIRGFDAMGYTPVPEPATIAALGLGALALLKRRRKSA